ncbi:trehalose-phosphatase [Megalodesulfovibrio paquesii]
MERTYHTDPLSLAAPEHMRWDAMQADAALWARLAATPRILLLDYDGTLAPFVPQGLRARPYPGAAELVERLMQRPDLHLALVSGRPTELVASLMGIDPAPEIWGCHGLEHRDVHGLLTRAPLEPGLEDGLRAAEDWAEARRHAGYLEHKPGCLALHVRGLPKAKAEFMLQDATEAWQAIANTFPLALHTFDGGLELRPRGVDKGRAVAAMRTQHPGLPILYLGDDLTDEDAFQALVPGDVPVLIRERFRQTAAAWWLRPPEELLAFLEALLHLPNPLTYGETS